MIKLLLFLKKNRLAKKWQMNKKVLMLSVDPTVLFYLVVFIGYIVMAIVMDGNLIHTIKANLVYIDTISLEQIQYVIILVPFFYLFQGFTQPGVLFSSAEYKLSLLPFLKQKIWVALAVERWLKSVLVFSVIGAGYFLLSDTPLIIILSYYMTLILMNIGMTCIQWKFYQLPIWWKILYLFIPILFMVCQLYMNLANVYILMVLLIILFNIICYRSLMQQINWDKVVATNDFKIWNMVLISHVTKVKFKKDRKHTIWQRFSFWTKPFNYEKDAMYHRLWQLYIEKNVKYILQVIGVLFLLLIVLGFLKDWLLLVAVILSIQIYSQLMRAIFKDRLTEDIVAILPWDMNTFQKTFRIWNYSISIILLIPLSIHLLLHFNSHEFIVFLLIILLFWLLMEEELMKQLHLLDTTFIYNEKIIQGSFLGTILIFLSIFYGPLLYISLILTVVLMIMKYAPSRS